MKDNARKSVIWSLFYEWQCSCFQDKSRGFAQLHESPLCWLKFLAGSGLPVGSVGALVLALFRSNALGNISRANAHFRKSSTGATERRLNRGVSSTLQSSVAL